MHAKKSSFRVIGAIVIGLGSCNSLTILCCCSTILAAPPNSPFSNPGIISCSFLVELIVCSLLLLLPERIVRRIANKLPVASSIVLLAIGLLVVGLALNSLPSNLTDIVLAIGLILVFSAQTTLLYAWFIRLMSLPHVELFMVMALAEMCAFLIHLAIIDIPSPTARIITPFIALLSFSYMTLPPERFTAESSMRSWKQPLARLLPIFLVFALIFAVTGVYQSLMLAGDFPPSIDAMRCALEEGGIVGCLLTIFALLVLKEKFVPARLFRLVPIVLSIAVLLPVSFEGFPPLLAFGIYGIGFSLFYALVWYFSIDFARSVKMPPKIMFAILLFMMCAPGLLGFCLAPLLTSASPENPFGSMRFAILCVVLIFSAVLIWPMPNKVRTGVEGDGGIEHKLQHVTANHGLTQRERDVLLLLAKGRSVPFIAEELCISKSTVSTHVRHIYEKMGVHSKQELLNTFEQSLIIED